MNHHHLNNNNGVLDISLVGSEMSTLESHSSSNNGNGKSDRNHPVLARMMRALKSQRKHRHKQQKMPAKSKSEKLFVNNKSFASSNNKLFGREKQLQQLECLLNQIISQSSSNNTTTNINNNTNGYAANYYYLALVRGKSGSGKSSLIDAFAKTIYSHQRSIFFTAGKFDQLKTHLPYAALIKAANNLAKKVVQSPHANQIKRRILDELGPNFHLLASIVQELSIFSSSASPNQQQQQKQNASSLSSTTGRSTSSIALTGKAITRFKLLFCSFVRSIATRDTPVVLFFDDLQWADEATMEMLKALLTDKLSNHVLLILSYRDNEMDPETLHKYFSISALDMDDESQLQQQGEDNNEEEEEPTSKLSFYPTHRIEISVPNLDQHTLNQMISAVLDEPEYSTTSLTDIILNKTQGNPFYALNFMDLLYANGMLYRDEENKAWGWNESIILQQTDVSDNLAQILEAKILRLPEKVRSILQLAAFIGHDFASSILTTIVYEEQDMIEGEYSFDLFDKQVIQQWIVDALNLALREGLVELSTTSAINQMCETSGETTSRWEGTYKFSHDRIQQCLYKDLMPDDVERRLLHQRIGKLIWKTISSQDCDTVEDWILFLAADNLNRGPEFVDEDGDRVEMIELNLRAGKLAASKAAFLVGVEYLRSGDKLITDDVFVESNYDLCIDLWCTAADMERVVGDFTRSNELGTKIHKYAREPEDHFHAYLAEIKSLATQGELRSAMRVAFEVLKQMGVKFPKKITSLTVAQEFIQTKLKLGNRTPEELLEKLPLLTDRKKLFALELLSYINGYAFMVGESAKFTFVAVGLRMTKLTLQYGLSELFAPNAFVGYGFVCCFFGKFDEGLTFGDAAQRLLERFDAQSNAPRTQLYYLSFIRPWTFGINEALCESFLQVYHKGMMVGDVDYGFTALAEWLFCGVNGAVPLNELVARGTRIRLEMDEYGQKSVLLVLVPSLQAARIMLGDKSNHNPAILSGEDMDLEEFTAAVEETKSNLVLVVLSLYELTVAIYFGDWERVQMKMPIIEKIVTASEGHFSYPVSLSMIVWCSYRLYCMTGKKRHQRIGRQHHQTLKRFAKLNSPLAIAFCKMLAAAKASFVKKKPVEECEELFVSALQDLEPARNLRLQSLVVDELAELFLKAQNIEKGVKYLQKSMEYSIRWGAKKKVKYLEREISAISESKKETYHNCVSNNSVS